MSRKNKIIFAVSLAVLIICIGYLGYYTYNSNRALEHFDELERIAEGVTSTHSDRENAFNYTKTEDGRLLCYAKLSERNTDMVGWIKISDTEINYPIMQKSEDNDFYLSHNFDKDKQSGGLPVLDYECDIIKPDKNLIVYGHNMRNGSVFANLLKYKKKDFYEQHKIITVDSIYEHRNYEIISVFNTKVGSKNEFKYHHFTDFSSQEDFDSFINEVKSLSIHEIDTTAQFGDELVTLSTCSYGTSNERFVVVAKRIFD